MREEISQRVSLQEQKLSLQEQKLSLQEQKDLVKSCMDEFLEVGQTWYVLDYKWYESWKDYSNYADSASNFGKDDPGVIDNSQLLEEDGSLKEKIVEDINFATVPERVWHMFVKCYGLANGQEPIPRPVIKMGTFTKVTKIELYPLPLLLAHYKHPTDGKLERCSVAMTIGELKVKMRKLYKMAEEAEVKLVGSYTSAEYDKLDDDSLTLEEANLQPRQFVVIIQKDGAIWPKLDKTTASCFTGSTKASTNGTSAKSYSSSNGFSSSYSNGSLSSSSFFSSSSEKAGAPGLCGLRNLGNTCFMNSSLQCLSNVPTLTKFFLGDAWKKDLNSKNPLGMKGEIAETYADLMKAMWSGKNSSVAPKYFKGAVGRFAPRFSGYQQQDSHELMAFLLDGLHEDLNRIKKKPYVEVKSTDGKTDEEAANQAWQDYLARNDSIIVDLFHGQLKSTVRCPDCKNESKTFDPFCYLSLPIPPKKTKKLKVFFVSRDLGQLPVKCRVKVPADGSIADLCKSVADKFDVSANKLVAAELYNSRFQKIYKDQDSVRGIQDRDELYVYEVDEAEGQMPVVVYFKETPTKSYQTARNLCIPSIISVPVDVTYDDLYDIINSRQRLVNSEEAMAYLSNNHNADIDQRNGLQHHLNGVDIVDKDMGGDVDRDMGGDVGSEKEEPMDICSSPKATDQPQIFDITLVSQYGYSQSNGLPYTGSLGLKPLNYLAVEFDKGLNVVRADDAFDVKEDDSLYDSQSEPGVTLEDCVQLFATEEELGKHDTWYCPVCKDHVQAFKQFALWKLPKYLVIQLKRYKSSMSSYSYYRDKVDTLVKYPVKNLDLTPRVIGSQTNSKYLYDLVSVSNHFGGLGGGHYTAYARNHDLDQWYYFDDSSVSAAAENSVVNKSGYLLVYERHE